jgi:hypothetical protein
MGMFGDQRGLDFVTITDFKASEGDRLLIHTDFTETGLGYATTQAAISEFTVKGLVKLPIQKIDNSGTPSNDKAFVETAIEKLIANIDVATMSAINQNTKSQLVAGNSAQGGRYEGSEVFFSVTDESGQVFVLAGMVDVDTGNAFKQTTGGIASYHELDLIGVVTTGTGLNIDMM